MKSLNTEDHSSGFLSVGGGFVGIMKIALTENIFGSINYKRMCILG